MGAEAVVSLEGNAVKKRRMPKRYRHPELDSRIRKERTRKEARLMEKAGRAIDVPEVLKVSEDTILMKFIPGEKVRSLKMTEKLAEKIGETVGKLHSCGIAHNDLTTSNMILWKNKVWIIDFGLADRGDLEDFATDLRVLRDSMNATHGNYWKSIVQGYLKTAKDGNAVLQRLKKVDERGRYKERRQ